MTNELTFKEIDTDTGDVIKEITIDDLKTLLTKPKDFFLVDVREADEWDQGYIPHATHVCRGDICEKIGKVIPDKQAQIVLYCGSGYRSALAASQMQKLGYEKVYSVGGGIKAWLKDHGALAGC